MLNNIEIEKGLESYEEKFGCKTSEERRSLIFKVLTGDGSLYEAGNGKSSVITEIVYILSFNKKLNVDMKNFNKHYA